MATQNNPKEIDFTTKNFKEAIEGNKNYYLKFRNYLTSTAWGLLSDWKEKADESFVTYIVDDTITKCGAAVTRGKNPANMKEYLRKAIENALLDSKKINPNKVSMSTAVQEEECDDEERMIKPKYGYRDNNTVEDDIKKSELSQINDRIFNFVRKHYGEQIYRMLQVKYDWGLSDSDIKKLSAIFLQCKTKDISTTTFLSQELGLTPARILDKINQYENKLRIDVPKYIISRAQYKDMMTFTTEDQLNSILSSVDPDTEMKSMLFSSLVYLQENMDAAQLQEKLQKEDIISQLGSILTRKEKPKIKNTMPFNNVFAENLEDYAGDFTQRDINYLNTLPRIKRGEIPFIILKNTAYQLVLDKYLQLYELCWKYGDDKGNNKRFAQCLNYHNGLQLHEIDAVAERLVFLPLENPTDDVAKEFFKRVFCGELEFACMMHIINGYSAYDLALGYYYHYENGSDLIFGKRYNLESMIFLP